MSYDATLRVGHLQSTMFVPTMFASWTLLHPWGSKGPLLDHPLHDIIFSRMCPQLLLTSSLDAPTALHEVQGLAYGKWPFGSPCIFQTDL